MLNFQRSNASFLNFKNRMLPMEDIVFFSESNAYKPFLFPLIEDLLKSNIRIVYLTTDPEDSILLNPPMNLKTYLIVNSFFLALTFIFLKARIFITTMPDLNKFHLKRSIYPVHYVYIQHSLCSTHMIYREGAFDHYDSILCAGKHHYNEIREWELNNNLAPKNLYHHGYIPIDEIVKYKKNFIRSDNKLINILVAPSWGKNGLISLGAEELLKNLLDGGYKVTLRLHPQSFNTSKQQVKNLKNNFLKLNNFIFDKDNSLYDVLYNTDVLITDWSGIALEFFFGFDKNIIFIDTPKKINNKRYKELKNIPVEIKIRKQIGTVIDFNEVNNIKNIVDKIINNKNNQNYDKEKLRDSYIFNFKKSVKEGTKIIKNIYSQKKIM